MIERRLAASPTGPFSEWPSSSGPRCMSVALMASSARGPAMPPPPAAMPQIPHTAGGARAARDRRGRFGDHAEVEARRAIGDVLEVVCELLLPRHLAGDAEL